MAKKKSMVKNMNWKWDQKSLSTFFFGVGTTMFVINITSLVTVMPYLSQIAPLSSGALVGYYTSLVSTLLIVVYSLYNMLNEE